MVYPETTHLPITYILSSTTKSHGFNHIASGCIFSVGQSCDHNCTAIFDKQYVEIFMFTEVSINTICPPIIQGHCIEPPKTPY